MSLRYMRMILFFDLPTETSKNRKDYRNFVKQIKKIGFIMLQFSVYIKLSINDSNVESTKKSIKNVLPKEGNISLLVITEKQFSEIEFLIGEFSTDIINSEDRLVEI